MSETTLVVVAQRAQARFFVQDGPGQGLEEVTDLVHPESRAHGIDLETDRPGRVQNRQGSVRHGLSQEETPKEREAANFAREVARAILHRRTHEGFERLVLVAEPGFLGLLRADLDPPTAALIRGEVHKNLTRGTVEQIEAGLEGVLRFA